MVEQYNVTTESRPTTNYPPTDMRQILLHLKIELRLTQNVPLCMNSVYHALDIVTMTVRGSVKHVEKYPRSVPSTYSVHVPWSVNYLSLSDVPTQKDVVCNKNHYIGFVARS
jgi:hypothetical protein